jgi:hypothetical protein
MTPESQSRRSLLFNGSVNRFPSSTNKQGKIEVFSVESAPRLCNEDTRPAEITIEGFSLRWQRVQLRLESQPVTRRISV